jgi:cell wall-associated NlpC family hydrolase
MKNNQKRIIGLCIGIGLLLSGVINPLSASAQYYVQKGDTMYKIASRNGMSLKDLISLNPQHTNPNRIHVGDYIVTRNPVETRKDIVDYARSLQDVTAYVYGGQEAPLRTDCSGWIQSIYGKFGYKLPRTSREQAKATTSIPFKDLIIGDLMFFSTRADKVITHVGIYMGPETNMWISNLNEQKDVEVLSTWGAWTQKHFLYGGRIAEL